MKIPSKGKKKNLYGTRGDDDDDDEDQRGGGDSHSGKPDWMLSDRSEQKEALREHRMQSGKRAPELYFKDGEERTIRICQPEALALIWQYNLKVNGKFQRLTAPARGEADLFRDEGLKPQLRAIYEVIDYKGYRDKKDKRHKNVRRFLVVSAKVHEQLEAIKKKLGPLNEYDLHVTRTGSDQSTTYTYIPGAHCKIPKEARGKEGDSLANRIGEFYKPKTEAEQRILLRKGNSRRDRDDEDDADDDDDD